MMLTGGKWGEASCAHCNRSLGAAITCPYCGFINAHVDSDGEALAEQERQEPVASVSLWHNHGYQNRQLEYYGNLPDGLHQLYAAPVDAKSIRAEALEEAAKVCDFENHQLTGMRMDNEAWAAKNCAAAIRGLK